MWTKGAMTTAIVLGIFFIYLNVSVISCTEMDSRQFSLQTKETNAPNFFRLLIMRLIFGIAKSMGFADRLSGFLGGVLVPPGADEYDDYGDYGDYAGDLF